MSKRTRRKHSSQQKAALLNKHHVEKVPVSDVCDQAEVQHSIVLIISLLIFCQIEEAGHQFQHSDWSLYSYRLDK